MKPEAQRIAITKACGWQKTHTTCGDTYFKKGESVRFKDELPDYLNDLNAMQEAEKVLDKDHDDAVRKEYASWLKAICGSSFWAVRATAAQRAEAFLRTIGKWEK